METDKIIQAIDDEIARLKQARGLLSNTTTKPVKRRKLSAEARKRIADAQKKRWAKLKKTS